MIIGHTRFIIKLTSLGVADGRIKNKRNLRTEADWQRNMWSRAAFSASWLSVGYAHDQAQASPRLRTANHGITHSPFFLPQSPQPKSDVYTGALEHLNTSNAFASAAESQRDTVSLESFPYSLSNSLQYPPVCRPGWLKLGPRSLRTVTSGSSCGL
jgi:hypothetical protein